MSGVNPDPEKQDGLPPEPGGSPSSLFRMRVVIPVLLALVFFGMAGWLAVYSCTPAQKDRATTVFIPRGAGVRGIARILVEQGLIADDIRFPVLARLTGTAGRLQAGEYLVQPHLTPLQILRLLEKGDVVRHPVTIPEGLTMEQIADILAEDGWVDRQRFLADATDPELIRSLGLTQPSLEGYLFPDTYLLTRGVTSEKSIIRMMVGRFWQIWKSIISATPPKMSRHEIITLASIVEKETGRSDERPIVARVFLNRLAKNMRLQSDPTVIYGLQEFNGNLTRKDLQEENPYNTYIIRGLPPGPICNPGSASIEAVLNPAEADYLYFVSRNDGSHSFSATLREHNRAVQRFQKNRNAAP